MLKPLRNRRLAQPYELVSVMKPIFIGETSMDMPTEYLWQTRDKGINFPRARQATGESATKATVAIDSENEDSAECVDTEYPMEVSRAKAIPPSIDVIGITPSKDDLEMTYGILQGDLSRARALERFNKHTEYHFRVIGAQAAIDAFREAYPEFNRHVIETETSLSLEQAQGSTLHQ